MAQTLVVIIIISVFLVWPSWGIRKRQIKIKGVTVYLDKTPVTFWCSVGFLYFCGLAFLWIIWQLPFSDIFFQLIALFLVAFAVVYYLKW
jgi:hypothetical protein